jgi:tRNA 5-methylaminomethyl-2-thiouridine biosynthesis bifunctional protein
VFRPLPSLDDNRLARITRAGFLYGLRHLERLARAGHAPRWAPCGVLHLARDAKQEGKMRAVVDAHQPPADYLRFVSREEAGARRLAGGGGRLVVSRRWLDPAAHPVRGQSGRGGRGHHPALRVAARRARAQRGRVGRPRSGRAEIARAPVAILANGVGIRGLPQAASLPGPARGQVSHLPAEPASAPRVVVCRLGYVSPEVDGLRCAGATFVADDEGSELREAEHRENMTKLDFILPGFAAPFDPASLAGRVGFRRPRRTACR